ncbi:hypothetical protein GCM10009838_64300 [Catenulispora subtropica]|uniref:Uncharacterized protein n=1 Tax=Catenulispora subtropica TaxID=450798 RepID=A0ABP5EAT5_9ACTN
MREQGMRCHQHRDLGGAALPAPRLAMRTLTLEDPALPAGPAGWMSARDEIAAAHAEKWGEDVDKGDQDPPEPDDPDEPFWVPEPPHSRPSRILFGEEDEERPGVPERDAKLNELSRRPEPADDGLPRRQHPRPERGDAPNEPARPDRREARIIEDYLRKHDQDEPPYPHFWDAEDDDEPEPVRPRPRPLFRDEVEPEPERGSKPEPESAAEQAWLGVRPLFRDEAPTVIQPRVESGSAEDASQPEPEPGPEPGPEPEPLPRRPRPPRIAPMRSVVLSARQPQPGPVPGSAPGATPEDAVPDTGLDSATGSESVARPGPGYGLENADTAPAPAPVLTPAPAPAADPPTLVGLPDDLSVPDFVVPGFSRPAPKPPLRTVLSTVLGPDLWQRCYAEWSPAHCISLARLARSVDGLAPSAAAALRSTAGASMRWLGVNREREDLADQVAAAISHPVGASDANRARTVRLYGAAICVALNIPVRRCACHRDLDRDVSSELIRLGLEELAGEVP